MLRDWSVAALRSDNQTSPTWSRHVQQASSTRTMFFPGGPKRTARDAFRELSGDTRATVGDTGAVATSTLPGERAQPATHAIAAPLSSEKA
jgi:hypothetical protein